MTNQRTCPECNTVDTRQTIGESCPACGFKYADRGPTKIAKGNSAVMNVGYIAAALIGAVIVIGFLAQLLA